MWEENKHKTTYTHVHLFIPLLDGQYLIDLGAVSQVKTVAFFPPPNHTKSVSAITQITLVHIAAKTLREKILKKLLFPLVKILLFSSPFFHFFPKYRVMNSAIYLLCAPVYEVIFPYFPYLASSLLSPSISF